MKFYSSYMDVNELNTAHIFNITMILNFHENNQYSKCTDVGLN